jgi:membrane protein
MSAVWSLQSGARRGGIGVPDEPKPRTGVTGRIRRTAVRTREFLKRGVWTYRPRNRRLDALLTLLRTAVLAVQAGWNSDMMLLAAALTYRVLFALVPLLAVMLALFKGLGGMESASDEVKRFLLQYIAPDLGQEVIGQIDGFIANINATAIGAAGLLLLAYTSLGLMNTVEGAMNRVWGIRKQRPLHRRVVVAWTALTIGPILVAASLAMSTFVQSHSLFVWLTTHVPGFGYVVLVGAPVVFGWILFTAVYLAIPNASVRFKAALAGGIAAGTAWEVMKSVYVWYNTQVVTSYKFYGSLGALPVFLLWIYLSWVIVLLGAEIAFAVQTQGIRRKEALSEAPPGPGLYALLSVSMVVERFVPGRDPPSADRIAKDLSVPLQEIEEVLRTLLEKGILRKTDTGGYVPGRDIARISVRDVVEAVREGGE